MNIPDLLPHSFFLNEDVVEIARDLIGKTLVTSFGGVITSGMITETEAYAGVTDRASHAFGGRYTSRTSIMYQTGGTAYVYLCYGVHSLFNVVTNIEGVPDAVLIRGIKPQDGVGKMLERTGKSKIDKYFGAGPGKVSRCLGIHFSHSGLPVTELYGKSTETVLQIWLENNDLVIDKKEITVGPRIGVDYAGGDALLPYRFLLKMK
jgi:DNA-3-methyladenine glycosylase